MMSDKSERSLAGGLTSLGMGMGLGLALAAGLWAPSASAMVVSGGAPASSIAPETARRTLTAAPATGAAAPTLDLVSGRIDAVDAAAHRITLRGQTVPLDPTLRVVQGGQQLSGGARALRAGQLVRFALQPGSAASGAERSVVLIYIDRQP